MATWVSTANTALMRIGAQPLQSEDVPEAQERRVVYDSVVGNILGGYAWTFCRKIRKLQRLGTSYTPVAHWRYAYALDPLMLGPPRAAYDSSECRRPFWDWELFLGADGKRQLHTDAEQVWLRYSVTVEPDVWPGDVREMIIQALMAEFALTVREDQTLYDRLRRIVYGPVDVPGEGGLIAQCKAKDAMGEPTPEIAGGTNPLVDVRRSGGGLSIGRWNDW